MAKTETEPTQMKISFAALGMAIGLVLGGIMGLIIDNMIIFAGGGLVLGVTIGSALDNHRKRINI